MQALTQSHMMKNMLSTRQFFRSGYYWKYGKDIPDVTLGIDCNSFDKFGQVPAYIVAYLIHIYGVQ